MVTLSIPFDDNAKMLKNQISISSYNCMKNFEDTKRIRFTVVFGSKFSELHKYYSREQYIE